MGSKVGVLKIAAKRIGVSYDEYLEKINSGMKWCTSCKQFLPIDEFCKDSSQGDGHGTKCSQCRHSKAKYPDRASWRTRRIMAEKGFLYCTSCKKFYSKEEMTVRSGRCGKCATEYARERYRNSEAVRKKAYQSNYSRKHGLNSIPQQYLTELFEKFDGMCAYCQKNKAESVDHIIPVSKGGNSVPGNLLPCCKSCNSSKHNKNVFEWLASKPDLSPHPEVPDYIGMAIGGLWACGELEVPTD